MSRDGERPRRIVRDGEVRLAQCEGDAALTRQQVDAHLRVRIEFHDRAISEHDAFVAAGRGRVDLSGGLWARPLPPTESREGHRCRHREDDPQNGEFLHRRNHARLHRKLHHGLQLRAHERHFFEQGTRGLEARDRGGVARIGTAPAFELALLRERKAFFALREPIRGDFFDRIFVVERFAHTEASPAVGGATSNNPRSAKNAAQRRIPLAM